MDKLLTENNELKLELKDKEMELWNLLNSHKEKENIFFNGLTRKAPAIMLGSLLETDVQRQEYKKIMEVLENEGFNYPRILIGQLANVPKDGGKNLFDLLKPATGLFDNISETFVFMTHGDNREDVTVDDVDGMFYELLPRLGFEVSHGLTVKLNGEREFVLGLLNRGINDVTDVFQALAFLATGMDSVEHVTMESSASEGTSPFPFGGHQLHQVLHGTTCKSTLKKVTLTKFKLMPIHQRGLRTPRNPSTDAAVTIVLDGVDLEGNGNALLQEDCDYPGQMSLEFVKQLGVPFSLLQDAITKGRLCTIGLDSIQLKGDDHVELKNVLSAAKEAGCKYWLETITHKTMGEQELIAFFDGLVQEKAFQDVPPEVGTDGYKDEWSPDGAYAGTNVNIWEQTNVGSCPGCSVTYKPGAAKCAACGAKLGAAVTCVDEAVVPKNLFTGSDDNGVFKQQDGGYIFQGGFHFGTDTTKSIGSTTEQWGKSTSTCGESFGFQWSTDTVDAKTPSKLSPSPAAAPCVSSLQKEPALESTKQAPTAGVKQAPAPTEGVKVPGMIEQVQSSKSTKSSSSQSTSTRRTRSQSTQEPPRRSTRSQTKKGQA